MAPAPDTVARSNASATLLLDEARLREELPSASSALRRILREHGTPGVDGVSPRDEAIALLQLAAEIEHALMVQYLYAAASLARSSGSGTGPWSKVMTVATQEMGHLISVQNLLISIGGPDSVHFGRDSIRSVAEKNPIPFVLEAVTRDSLARYVAVEMPAEIDDEDLRKKVEPMVEVARRAGVRPHGVGALYAKIFWIFQPTDDPTPPLNLSPALSLALVAGRHLSPADFVDAALRERHEALRAEWARGSIPGFLLETVSDAVSGLKLISAISKQGEGLEQASESHFREFLALTDALEAGSVSADPLPRTPVAAVPAPSDAVDTSTIATDYARDWADLCDVRYNLLILDLWHAMVTERQNDARAGLIDLAFVNMGLVAGLTTQLLRLRDAPTTASDAAPPFGLLADDFPADKASRWKRHGTLLKLQSDVRGRLQSRPNFGNDFDGFLLLQNIEQSDAARQTLIDKALQG